MPGMSLTYCTHVDLLSHWHLAAPVHQVWAALADVPAWPHWWPQVRRVQLVAAGAPGGVGRVHRIHWASGLGYAVALEIEAVEVLPPERLRGRARGTMQGEGVWLLSAEPGGTQLTYLWRVRLVTRWMRWLAPLLAPVFRRNHERVMRAGADGLARYLAAQAASARSRSAAPPTPAAPADPG